MLQCRLTLLVSIIMTVTMLVLSPAVHSSPVNMRNNQIAGHPLSKRSFFDIQCKGVYDKSIFARLDRICEDCYDLFRAPQIHTLCRENCFANIAFVQCEEALTYTEEERAFNQQDIVLLNGIPFPVPE
uniref:Ion transport peptide n=2 Tax=Cacopsylla melanoneura TaxID=428564 RepID=A0A8D8RWB5_9HEMI